MEKITEPLPRADLPNPDLHQFLVGEESEEKGWELNFKVFKWWCIRRKRGGRK
jgi:hypothetical protein